MHILRQKSFQYHQRILKKNEVENVCFKLCLSVLQGRVCVMLRHVLVVDCHGNIPTEHTPYISPLLFFTNFDDNKN